MQDADRALRATEDAARRRWGGVPQTDARIPAWAEAAVKLADADPQVVEARQDAEHAHRAQQQLTRVHMDARAGLRRRIFGDRAAQAEWERITAEQAKAVAAARAAKLARFASPSSDHRRTGPERDVGPSL